MSEPTKKLRLRTAQRDKVMPVPARLEEWLPPDHLARLIWEAVGQLDLSGFTQKLKVVEGHRGHPAADPRVMLALWIYATTEGVSSARQLAELCVEHLAYIWLCGGMTINYHSLSDFRVQHQQALDELMSQVLGVLSKAGLVEYERVAQDGIRVRASAGAASFRREGTLQKYLEEARKVVAQLKAQAGEDEPEPDGNGGGRSKRQAARERAAEERLARLEAAMAELPAVQKSKPAGKRGEARVSTSDPEARIMKMADGGFRPGYNLQFAADGEKRVIVGVAVTNIGSDNDQAPGMVEQVKERSGQVPEEWLMDGGFNKHAAIEKLAAQNITVYSPVPKKSKKEEQNLHEAKPGDSEVIGQWRERMGTAEAKEIYQERASIIEWVNAQARQRHGLQQLRVRGIAKVRSVALWIALTHNLLLWLKYKGVDQKGELEPAA